jgi:hypothetical protein
MMALEGSTWKIWRASGEDWHGQTIEGRWERGTGDAGDEWGIDFPINYFRK